MAQNSYRKSSAKSTKAPAWLTVLAAIIAAVYFLFFSPETNIFNNSDGDLTVHFIDIGQGDSALIVAPGGECMLIDAGPNSDEMTLKSHLDSLNVTKIKYAVFTHPHEDHIGGADVVLTNYEVGTVLMPNATQNTATFEKMIRIIDEKKLDAIVPSPGDTYDLGGAKITVLAPISETYSNQNNYSIVLKIEYGEISFLFTGDAEKLAEDEMLTRYSIEALDCDVLKAGHHGSSTSNSEDFIKVVSPDIAVISCKKGNDYGHPHKEVISLFNKYEITVYRTDNDGSVVLTTDGSTVRKVG